MWLFRHRIVLLSLLMKVVIHSVAGFKVCILDAAVLLEAEWDHACHEVWVTVVPPKEVSEQ